MTCEGHESEEKNIWSWISFSPSCTGSPVIVWLALFFWMDNHQQSALLQQMSSERLETLSLRLLHNRPCLSGGGCLWCLMRLVVCLFSHLLSLLSVMFKISHKHLLTLIMFRVIGQLIKPQETHKLNLKIKHTFVKTYTSLYLYRITNTWI